MSGETCRHGDDVLQALELAEDDGAVRPGAGERDIEMIAAGLGGKAALALGAGAAVRRHPVVEAGGRADEFAVLGAQAVLLPDAIDQKPHARCSVALTLI